MGADDLFRVEFSEDGRLGVEFSGDFLSSSHEGQIQALEAFLSGKMQEPFSTQDVSQVASENEIAIILAETLLAKLKRGEWIEKDSSIDISFEELMSIHQNMEDPALFWHMGANLEDEAED